MTVVVVSVICWFKIRRKLGSPKETTSHIHDIPNFPIYETPDIDDTADVHKATTLELNENVAYGADASKTTTLELNENVAYGVISH